MKLTIAEINASMQALHHDRETYEDKQRKELEQDNKVYQAHLKTLREDKETAYNKLIKNISKMFKGMKPVVSIDDTHLEITLLGKKILEYSYNSYSFNGISKELANTACELYEDEYGEPKEEEVNWGESALMKIDIDFNYMSCDD